MIIGGSVKRRVPGDLNDTVYRLVAVGKAWSMSGKASRGASLGKHLVRLRRKASRGVSLECAMKKLLLARRKLPLKLLPPPTHYSVEKCTQLKNVIHFLLM